MGEVTTGLVLSIFPGIGLLDMAFEQEGFCVVRGPDLLWGGDVRSFHPPAGKFDGVIGGPPCQLFSQLRHLNPKAGQKHGNMIPEFERVVGEARPGWFVMENVRGAPEPIVSGYVVRSTILNNRWLGEVQDRARRFSFGTSDGLQCLRIQTSVFESIDYTPAVCSDARVRPVALGDQGAPVRLFDDSPFTESAKRKMVGNGVPLPMGRAVAQAVKRAIGV